MRVVGRHVAHRDHRPSVPPEPIARAIGPIAKGEPVMTKQELKEQNEALRNLLMEIRDMIDSELEAMEEFDEEEEEEEEEDED
jgi:hypothetical protein